MKNMKIHTKIIIAFTLLEIFAIIDILLGCRGAKTAMTMTDPTKAMKNLSYTALFEIVFFTVVCVSLDVYISRLIRKSLKKIKGMATEIANGNVNISVEKERNDEFGDVIDEMNVMLNSIRYQSSVAEEVASGDLTIEVNSKGPQDSLGNALIDLVSQNAHAIGNITDAAMQVMTSSTQVASASEALAQGSTEQASAIEEITASITEIATKTKQNASEANEAANLVNMAIVDVKQGNEQMKEMMSAMDDINISSESISRIMKVIDDIAFQTNILALNAAVEAARAGEAGKGFAVVAEEVRNLAAKSAQAAAETADLIEDSKHKVEAGLRIVGDTAEALEAITSRVTQSEQLIGNIAESSNYQATAVAQINQAIGQVSQVVQTNSATSEECAAASEELSNQALRMKELLSVYKLEQQSSSTPFISNKVSYSAPVIQLEDEPVAEAEPVQAECVDIKPEEELVFTKEIMFESPKKKEELIKENPNEAIISLGDDFGKY